MDSSWWKNVLWHSLDSFLTKWYENENKFFTYPVGKPYWSIKLGFMPILLLLITDPPPWWYFQFLTNVFWLRWNVGSIEMSTYLLSMSIYIHIYSYWYILALNYSIWLKLYPWNILIDLYPMYYHFRISKMTLLFLSMYGIEGFLD